MPKQKRNYTRERQRESKARKAARAARNRARRAVGLKVGDPRTVSHKRPLSKGGTNKRSNLGITSKKANDKQGGRLGGRRKKT